MKTGNMKNKITVCILFAGVLLLAGVYLFQNNRNADNDIENNTENSMNENSEKQKVTHSVSISWPYHTFETAVEEATAIVYGKVVDKSDTKMREIAVVNGKPRYEYYKEMSVEVLDVLKGDMDATSITYRELGGETDELIYLVEGLEPVEIEGEYIFFLNENSSFLSPMTLIQVQKGTVLIKGKVAPVSENEQETSAVDMSVEKYLEAIEAILTK